MDNIKLVKLVNGEEIVCSIAASTESEYVLHKPVRVGITPKGIAIAPVSMFLDDSVEALVIKSDHILWVSEVIPDLKNKYNQDFGNGLVMPIENKSIILPNQ